jgi:photosystem II stability/assembly factor-like uncharacterized protein
MRIICCSFVIALGCASPRGGQSGSDLSCTPGAQGDSYCEQELGAGAVCSAAGQCVIDGPDAGTPSMDWELVNSETLSGLYSVTFGNGIYVAVGNSTIATSPDGFEWTLREHPTSTASLRAVTFADDMYVAVGSDGEILTSSDGIEWKAQPEPTGQYEHLQSITYGRSMFVAISGWGYYTSDDGYAWSKEEVAGVSAKGIFGITFANDLFVMVSPMYQNESAIGRSNDGIVYSWDLCPITEARSIAYGNGEWLVAGAKGEIFASSDGEEWEERVPQAEESNEFYKIVHTGDEFVAVGKTAAGVPLIMYSQDGTHWSEWSDFDGCGTGIVHGVAASPGSIVAVGTGGCVWVHEL